MGHRPCINNIFVLSFQVIYKQLFTSFAQLLNLNHLVLCWHVWWNYFQNILVIYYSFACRWGVNRSSATPALIDFHLSWRLVSRLNLVFELVQQILVSCSLGSNWFRRVLLSLFLSSKFLFWVILNNRNIDTFRFNLWLVFLFGLGCYSFWFIFAFICLELLIFKYFLDLGVHCEWGLTHHVLHWPRPISFNKSSRWRFLTDLCLFIHLRYRLANLWRPLALNIRVVLLVADFVLWLDWWDFWVDLVPLLTDSIIIILWGLLIWLLWKVYRLLILSLL